MLSAVGTSCSEPLDRQSMDNRALSESFKQKLVSLFGVCGTHCVQTTKIELPD